MALLALSLPDFRYESADSTGLLNRAVLARWLLGRQGLAPTNGDTARAGQIYDYLRAAADRILPPPNHHGYSFGDESEEPLVGRIQHFRLGTGIGGGVCLWIAVWLVVSLASARLWFRNHGGVQPSPTPTPSPVLKLRMARIYLSAAEPQATSNISWSVTNEFIRTKSDATRGRWIRGVKSKQSAAIRSRLFQGR